MCFEMWFCCLLEEDGCDDKRSMRTTLCPFIYLVNQPDDCASSNCLAYLSCLPLLWTCLLAAQSHSAWSDILPEVSDSVAEQSHCVICRCREGTVSWTLFQTLSSRNHVPCKAGSCRTDKERQNTRAGVCVTERMRGGAGAASVQSRLRAEIGRRKLEPV